MFPPWWSSCTIGVLAPFSQGAPHRAGGRSTARIVEVSVDDLDEKAPQAIKLWLLAGRKSYLSVHGLNPFVKIAESGPRLPG